MCSIYCHCIAGCRDALMDYVGDKILANGALVIFGVFGLQVNIIVVDNIFL